MVNGLKSKGMVLNGKLLGDLIETLLDDMLLAKEEFLSLGIAVRNGEMSMDDCVKRNSEIFLNIIPKVVFAKIALNVEGVLSVSPDALELIKFWEELFSSFQEFCHEQN